MIRGDGVLRLCQGPPLHAIDATTYATTPLGTSGRHDTRPRAEGNDNYREEVLREGRHN